MQIKKTWFSYPEIPFNLVSSLTSIRCTLTAFVKKLLRHSGNSINSDTTLNQKISPDLEKFFKSIQSNDRIYKASLSRQLAADLSPDVEETTFKDTAKSWFIKTADFGDDYDQLLQHPDGRFTKLLEDIAYYYQIFQQGYDKIILIRPSIYTGYDIQLTAAMQALGYTKEQFKFIVVQPIKLYAFHKPTKKVHPIPDIPTEELIQTIGIDALRWHSLRAPLTRSAPINISTAGQPTPKNTLYRVQSAHIRCCTLLHQAYQQGLIQLNTRSRNNWQIIPSPIPVLEYTWDSPDAQTLVTQLQAVPKILQQSATEVAPHLLCQHLEAISSTCHQWCHSLEPTTQDSALLLAIKQTIFDLLENILGITAPDR
ncbi:MAG: hypothetical protein F6J92_18175 [Symploca sp. SIO1A3]|nr:hypothetical protein [Symploca sp. SIO1A3]